MVADRRDQVAANLYTDAVRLAGKQRWGEAAELLRKALARGATEPNEQQGSQSRFLVDRYDPYYWLGVCYMELGEDDKALIAFSSSESYGVIRKWPDLSADLDRRKRQLESRLAASEPRPHPTAPPIAGAEGPASSPAVAVARPSPEPVASVSRATPAAAAPSPAPRATGVAAGPRTAAGDPDAATARRLAASFAREARDVEDLLTAAAGLSSARPKLASRVRLLQGQLGAARAALPADPRATLIAVATRAVVAIRGELSGALLAESLRPSSPRRWEEERSLVDLAAKASPSDPRVYLVRAASLASEAILTGAGGEQLVPEARRAFAEWRRLVGPGAPLPPALSPALLRLLS
ncbi:MAG: hypothetical protein EDX89_15570 [Acidobacteria bacterium]|nr:MAG: hypothetical protein EDX89_15570 [Acidobacteriota bacterium]